MEDLYTKEYRKIMRANADSTSMCSNRVEEIINFARSAGFKRIGIAHCITFGAEADLLEQFFSKYFEVYTVDCKYGRLKASDLWEGGGGRVLCNPVGQAAYLNEKKTDLNISMGLCVGHDMIFSKASEAWVTNLFDKDFTNNNNPAQAVAAVERKMHRSA